MRITDRGPWPHAEMGDLQQACIGDWVLALGHPGGFDLRRSLVVRLGRIIRMDAERAPDRLHDQPGRLGRPAVRHARPRHRHPQRHQHFDGRNFHVAVTAFYKGWDLLAKAPPEDEEDKPRLMSAPRAWMTRTAAG